MRRTGDFVNVGAEVGIVGCDEKGKIVGGPIGLLLGIFVGEILGCKLGMLVGINDGEKVVGKTVGELVSPTLEGATVGLKVERDGLLVGNTEGCLDGRQDGCEVG